MKLARILTPAEERQIALDKLLRDNPRLQPAQANNHSLAHLVETLSHIDPLASASAQLINLAEAQIEPKTTLWLNRFLTADPKMIELKDMIRELVNEKDPVLITGPTGTGKGTLAKALHGERTGDFLHLNCGALPEHLIESELFGHVKGAFTGAANENIGILRAAGSGTVFLDEIAELKLGLQSKLLLAIEENIVRPVGATKTQPISCRFVAATNRNLFDMVRAKDFRSDLYARLSIFEAATTGLVERRPDITLILNSYGTPVDLSEIVDSPRDFEELEMFNCRKLYKMSRRIKLLGRNAWRTE